jgi:hypothetical protein
MNFQSKFPILRSPHCASKTVQQRRPTKKREFVASEVRMRPCLCVLVFFLMVGLATALPVRAASAEPPIIYYTGFERSEGFDSKVSLIGQDQWIGFGSGGNGILTNSFNGDGQSAYIGFAPPEGTGDQLNVLRPLKLAPISTNRTLVTFAVLMQIVDSTNNEFDDFRWSVYNTNEARLFTLDFDNASRNISYGLDDNKGFVPTGSAFDTDGFYELIIQMNFARNLWSASLNGAVIVNSKPITTRGEALNVADIDAVWSIHNPSAPGNNYMIFDDYLVTAEGTASIPPVLEHKGFSSNRMFQLRIYGEQGLTYLIEASTDLRQWQTIREFTAPLGGIFDFVDPSSSRSASRFYRTRQKP